MKGYNLKTGSLGEALAKEYLENKGYKIVEQNRRNKYGEIDLVAHNRSTMIFVEVKTRIGEQFGIPEDAINKDKMRRLVRNAQAYIAYNAKNYKSYRIDAICIVLDENRKIKRIEHYENINCP